MTWETVSALFLAIATASVSFGWRYVLTRWTKSDTSVQVIADLMQEVKRLRDENMRLQEALNK